jgi:hypothetical protein
MSTICVDLDRNIATMGWNSAATNFLENFVTDVRLQGEKNIPSQGPLMVVCNHPAAYDVAILAASIKRDDLKILGSDVQIIRMLPNLNEHAITVPYNIPSRLETVRNTIRQLQSLAGWSPSIELFLRRVPETISVVAMASGVLSARWYKNPLINIWKKYEQRQKVAEIFQIASQLWTGKTPDVTPFITFSPPLTVAELGGEGSSEGTLLKSLTDQAASLLQLHPHG